MSRPTLPFQKCARRMRSYRSCAALGLVGLLAACAQTPVGSPESPVTVTQEAANYRQHARSYYAPPGPPEDPWGPYIREASTRFDVPEPWIRSVMMRESRGQLYDSNGNFTVSVPGAMGLLQLMPPTYDDMRTQYALGDDPFDPHDNILAGTAYLRQLYDVYGSPGFLAAYNDGPGNLERYLRQGRTLPRETRRYVAAIGRQIVGVWPHNRSDADLMVARHDPNARVQIAQNVPNTSMSENYGDENTGESSAIRAAWRRKNAPENAGQESTDDAEAPVQVAEAPDATPSNMPPATSTQSVSAAWAARGIQPTPAQSFYRQPQQSDDSGNEVKAQQIPIGHKLPAQPIIATLPPTHPHYHLALGMPPATIPRGREIGHLTGGDWAIQVGAFANAGQAGAAASHAHSNGGVTLAAAHTQVASVKTGRTHLFRARLTGLSHENAIAACRRLSHASPCAVIPPGTY